MPHWAPLVVYGDIVLPMLHDLKRKLRVPTVCLNATHLPFATGSFQMIWCSLLVDHIGDVRSWVSELMRLLDPGGVLALACWDQSLLPPELYPEGKMLYRTSAGGVLAAPTYRNWNEAKSILTEHDPATEIDSHPIVKDKYVLEIAWTGSRG
jgi:SAM-dependent methyltransferase